MQDFKNLTILEASNKAQQLGMDVVVIEAGTPAVLTNEFRKNRVTFSIKEGKVISFRIG